MESSRHDLGVLHLPLAHLAGAVHAVLHTVAWVRSAGGIVEADPSAAGAVGSAVDGRVTYRRVTGEGGGIAALHAALDDGVARVVTAARTAPVVRMTVVLTERRTKSALWGLASTTERVVVEEWVVTWHVSTDGVSGAPAFSEDVESLATALNRLLMQAALEAATGTSAVMSSAGASAGGASGSAVVPWGIWVQVDAD